MRPLTLLGVLAGAEGMKNAGEASRPSSKTYHLERQTGFLLRQVGQRHTAIFANRMGDEITTTQ